MKLSEFGDRLPDVDYISRACVYGVALDDRNCVLVTTFKERLVLPGGGIDGFESESETLVRECLEETGWRVAPAGLVGRARQWVSRPAVGKFRDKACSFYRIDLVERLGPPTDERHTVEWMPLERAARCLHYDSHRWALAQALRGTTAP